MWPKNRKVSSPYYPSLSRPKRRRRLLPGFFAVLFILLVLAGVAYYLWGDQWKLPAIPKVSSIDWSSYLPLPTKLLEVEIVHNGKLVGIKSGSIIVVRSSDRLQIKRIKTDGWVSWGTKLVSPEMDVGELMKHPVTVKDLWPNERFANPKEVQLEIRFWNRLLGQVTLVVQPDVKDWLQKANMVSDSARKIAYLEKALEQDPNNTFIKIKLAGLYAQQGVYQKAAQLYAEILSLGTSRPLLEKQLDVYRHMGEVDKALSVYLQLLKLSADVDTFNQMIEYLQKHKSERQMVIFLERHRDDIPERLHGLLYLSLAEYYSDMKVWSRAVDAYRKALDVGIQDPNVYYNLSVAAEQAGELNDAIHALKKYLKKSPLDVESWLRLAKLERKKGNRKGERKAYEKTLQIQPDNEEALVNLVRLLEQAKAKKELLATYEKLAKLRPKEKVVLFNLGVLYFEAKQWNKATKAFEQVAKLDPADVKAREYLLDLYTRSKKIRQKERVLTELAMLNPTNVAYYDQLFELYDSERNYNGLVQAMKKATGSNPNDIHLYQYLLYGYLKLGNQKAAARVLEKLSELKPGEKKYLRQAAQLYEDLGDYEAAREKVGQILKLDPNDKQAQEDYLRLRMKSFDKAGTG